jgi:hypothetical protein
MPSPTSRPKIITASQTIEISQNQTETNTDKDLVTWQSSFDGQTDSQYSHEGLIGHWVNDCTNHRLEIPSSGDIAIHKVRDASISK